MAVENYPFYKKYNMPMAINSPFLAVKCEIVDLTLNDL